MHCLLTAEHAVAYTALAPDTVSSHALNQPLGISFVHFEKLSFKLKCTGQSPSPLGLKKWSSSANMGTSSRVVRMASSSSDVSPQSDDNEIGSKDHNSAKGGIREWFRGKRAQNKKLVESLKRYGVAGMLSYGLLNTVYYLVTFLFVWFYVSPSEGGLGFIPAAQRFVKLFAMVWAGSQVTKLIRAAGALSLAPFVDRGLNWFTARFNFKSRGKAFGFIVGVCIVVAVSVFLVITTLWA
ncbi:hypothetical protein R1sor_022161 [Riccia sorocarpa]|uniref:Uncharacterized protein n=1 Tax=Riccia sorocarpa TaxID=122646 RepID=A0ABD3GM86_9MARC